MTARFDAFYREFRMCDRKKQYKSEAQAKQAGNRDRKQYRQRMRPYLCPHCGFWHLARVKK